jgi:putative DNA primase/helicase
LRAVLNRRNEQRRFLINKNAARKRQQTKGQKKSASRKRARNNQINIMNNTAAAPKPQAKISLPEITQKLHNVKKIANGFSARCPNHDDAKNSLLLKEQPSGKITIDCMAGCRFNDVLARLDLKAKDLYPNNQTNGRQAQPKPKLVKTYQYTDEDNNLLYEVCRFEPKDFRQRKPNGKGGFDWNLNGTRRVLYRLPELLNANKEYLIFLCEGEKDADNLAAIELLSTTNSEGAAVWRDEYTETLRESRVVICVDHDRAGIERGERIAEALSKADCQVQIFDPFRNEPTAEKHGKDISDYLEAGNTAKDLLALINNIELYEPKVENKLSGGEIFKSAQNHDLVLGEILEQLQPINFRIEANLSANDKLTQKHLIVLVVERVLKTALSLNCGLCKKDEFLYTYNGEFWKLLNRDILECFLGECAERLGVDGITAKYFEFRKKLYSQFLAIVDLPQPENDREKVLINLRNGTFEISKNKQTLRAFRREDFLAYQLPFDYDENANCPIFKAYLDRVLPEKELQNILAEFFGYVFTKGLKMEKALLLYGSGANGKSVLFDITNAILGRENISNFSLSDLLEEHNRALITNKLLNYGSEINASLTRDIFKNLVSTEPIQARLKYGNSFTMEDYAKLAFNCNELPKDFDHLHAYFRRLLIIPFRVTIPEAEQNKTLAQTVIKTELSGVFNWIITGLRRLLINEQFTDSDIVKETLATYRRESDSVSMFVDESNYKPSFDEYDKVSLKNLFYEYKQFCKDNGFREGSSTTLRKRLESLGFESKKTADGQMIYLKK